MLSFNMFLNPSSLKSDIKHHVFIYTTMRITTLLLLPFLFIGIRIDAQHAELQRSNIWYFGEGAGLDFSSGSPVVIYDSAMKTFEGCSTMSDINGNLLMYSDGDTIWNRIHQPMPNGTGLLGCPELDSSSQGVMIIPQPENDNIYYIFTNSCNEHSGVNGYRYSVVDMNLNGGLGDVIPGQKNILLYAPSPEALAATYNCDETGIWVMSHELNSDRYMCYFLDENGLSATPVISSIEQTEEWACYHFRFSPDGKKLAVISGNVGSIRGEILDFDNETGQLSNPTVLLAGFGRNACFSSDNSKLYFSSGNIIYQHDLNSGTMVEWIDIYADNTTHFALANAPNGQIIISSPFTPFLSTLLNPNADLSSSNIARFNINLGDRMSTYSLPNFMQNYFNTSTPKECETNLSTEDYGAPFGLNVFPNPASDNITITYDSAQNAYFRLINIFGQSVKEEYIHSNQIIIDVSALPRGVYYAIATSQNKSQMQRVILY